MSFQDLPSLGMPSSSGVDSYSFININGMDILEPLETDIGKESHSGFVHYQYGGGVQLPEWSWPPESMGMVQDRGVTLMVKYLMAKTDLQ